MSIVLDQMPCHIHLSTAVADPREFPDIPEFDEVAAVFAEGREPDAANFLTATR
jgi:hypothetical protein